MGKHFNIFSLVQVNKQMMHVQFEQTSDALSEEANDFPHQIA